MPARRGSRKRSRKPSACAPRPRRRSPTISASSATPWPKRRAIVARAKEDAERIGREAEIELDAALKRREASTLDKIAQAEAKALAEVRNVAVDVAIETTKLLLLQSLDKKRAVRC
jgi:hypothetical protein